MGLFDSVYKPPILYKYCSNDLIGKGYFKNPTLRFTPWNELSDLFDMNPVLTFPEFDHVEVVQAMGGDNSDFLNPADRKRFELAVAKAAKAPDLDFSILFQKLDKEFGFGRYDVKAAIVELKKSDEPHRIENRKKEWKAEARRRDWGILCVSSVNDCRLCWEKHNKHTGFVIALRTDPSRTDFLPVRYVEGRVRSYPSHNETIGSERTFLTKDVELAFEKEWRYIIENASQRVVDGNNYLVTIAPQDIDSILIGARISSSDEQVIRTYCSSNSIKLFRMEDDLKSFNLNIKQVI